MTKEMDWDETFQAMQALTHDACIRRRDVSPRWYIDLPRVERKEGALLSSGWNGGDSPVAAINTAWRTIINMPSEDYLVVNAMGKRRAVRWNGFMWTDVQEEVR